MEEWTFENADMSDAVMHKAKSYVDNWEEMKRSHIGCLFWDRLVLGKVILLGVLPMIFLNESNGKDDKFQYHYR